MFLMSVFERDNCPLLVIVFVRKWTVLNRRYQAGRGLKGLKTKFYQIGKRGVFKLCEPLYFLGESNCNVWYNYTSGRKYGVNKVLKFDFCVFQFRIRRDCLSI